MCNVLKKELVANYIHNYPCSTIFHDASKEITVYKNIFRFLKSFNTNYIVIRGMSSQYYYSNLINN